MAKAAARRQPEEALTAALLLRVSDARQAEDDRFSLDAQRRALLERCRREGWTPGPEYIGEGESAFTNRIDKRQTISDMLKAAATGDFQILLVHDLSRFARDEELGHAVFNLLERHGVRLVNASSDIDYTTAEGRMMLSINLGLDSYGSRKMSFHIKKAKQERFERGLHTADVPFGYEKGATNKDPLVPVATEAAAIAEAFRDRAAGMGYTEIARRWNALGLRPHSKRGHGVFGASAVQSVLENDFYAGRVQHLGERRPGLHQAIISETEYLAAQGATRHQPSRSRQPRMLAGLAVCSVCDGPVWQCKSGPKLDYTYYREASSQRELACSNRGRMWRAELAEAEVDAVIASMAVDVSWLEDVDRAARRMPRPDNGRRRELEEDKRRLKNLYLAKQLDDNEWRLRLRPLEDQLARLPTELPATLQVAAERLVKLEQVWRGMTAEEKRGLCRILFSSIRMDTRGKRLWLEPWPEFAGLFDHRRDYCRHGTPGRTRTCAQGLGNLCSIL